MALQLRKGGVWQTITALKIYATGAWRTIKTVQVYSGGAWRTVANFVPASAPFSVTAKPAIVSGTNTLAGVQSNATTATPTGGLAPYTYQWTVVFGSATAKTPTSASTTFFEFLGPGEDDSGTATCTVTDSTGATATTSVAYSLSRA